MIKEKVFREYDIRGIYPSEVDEELAYNVGRSYATMLRTKYNMDTCCVGMDNRLSSPTLKTSLVKGLNDSGVNVIDLGLCTTPMYFYGCIYTRCYGMMVTASHNPKDDNGFKFCFDNLGNARGKQVYDFRDFTLNGKFIDGKGYIKKLDIFPYYLSLIKSSINMGDRKIKVVIDPGNGTTSLFAKEIYSSFPNLDITMINDMSDPTFPNHHPDPSVYENLVQLQAKVKEVGADIGLAFDGDGDRVGFVDQDGNVITSDKFMVIALRDLFKNSDDKRVLYDVKCSKIIKEEAEKLGGEAVLSRTGASYTRYFINKDKIPFGGEFSGHFVYTDRWKGFDSGMYVGLRMLEILSKTDKKVSDLLDGIKKYYNTPEIKIAVDDDKKDLVVNKVIEYCHDKKYNTVEIDGVRVEADNYWGLVRKSNTGPNLTLRFEATTEKKLEQIKDEFINKINEILKEL